MKTAPAQLAQRLTAALGADSVVIDAGIRAEHNVDGLTPLLVCTPMNIEQIVAAVRICGEAQAALVPWGGGTAMALGNVPQQADVVMKTSALNRLIEHDHANLTATVQSGVTSELLQDALAPKRQFAPIDPPFAARSTIGGVVAANLNGPRRSSYGSVRDLIIGMKVVLGSGEMIKVGGKVVKNVAGYDMCKLFTGSLGTLGVITEVTLRVAPSAESSATGIAHGSLEQCEQASKALVASKLLPSAAILSRAANQRHWRLTTRFEGFAATVARQLKDWERIVQRLGMTIETLESQNQRSEWQALQDFPLEPSRLIYRVIVPRGIVCETARLVEEMNNDVKKWSLVADLGVGTIWIAAQSNLDIAGEFTKLIALAQARRGHAVIFAGSSELKSTMDVWGPAPPALPLMAKIKQQFDPKGILNPGRFIGGL